MKVKEEGVGVKWIVSRGVGKFSLSICSSGESGRKFIRFTDICFF
jgi:hypothetical protein